VANATINNVESSCTADKVRLWLDWSEKNFIQIVLKHDNVTYSIDEISLKVNDLTSDKKGLGQFATNLKSHYKCSQKSTVDLEQGFTVLFTDLKMQAFQEDPKLEFTGKQLECQSDSHNDTVIIAVGCALAILVVIILVAYLIVRRRNRQRGYQSV
jgi:lysosomal-associated membrane protein 1/2